MKKIVCAHLYNDFSGSPLVLSTVIKTFRKEGHDVEVMTSENTKGFLSDLDVKLIGNGYKYLNNRYLRLVVFILVQLKMFFQTLKFRNEEVTIYVNTLLPFGAAVAGKLMGKKVMYHFHETSLNPVLLKNFLKWIASKTADQIIYVSEFLKEKEGLANIPSSVIHNTLSAEFIQTAKAFQKTKTKKKEFVILMLCSLKAYKGVNEFVELANRLSAYTFNLVLNASDEEINNFFKKESLPQNLNLFPRQSNVHPFFQQADLVLNLSHPDTWIETFGMTLLEGMQYGLPIIAPPVGGPTEIVMDDYNGYLIDQRNENELSEKITEISEDKKLYRKLSNNSKVFVEQFSMDKKGIKYLELVG